MIFVMITANIGSPHCTKSFQIACANQCDVSHPRSNSKWPASIQSLPITKDYATPWSQFIRLCSEVAL